MTQKNLDANEANQKLEEQYERFYNEYKSGVLSQLSDEGITGKEAEKILLEIKHEIRLEVVKKLRASLNKAIVLRAQQPVTVTSTDDQKKK